MFITEDTDTRNEDINLSYMHMNYATPLEDKYYSDSESPTPVKYPSRKKTRYFNHKNLLLAKAATASKLSRRVLIAHKNNNKTTLSNLKKEVDKLRPPIRVIKQIYRDKGEPEYIVNKLVTPAKYPTLPYVKLTKRQYNCLMDMIDGNYKKWKQFITNGFV